jgi:hypothetical protein
VIDPKKVSLKNEPRKTKIYAAEFRENAVKLATESNPSRRWQAAILIMKSSGRRNRDFKTFEHEFEHLSPIVKANISS